MTCFVCVCECVLHLNSIPFSFLWTSQLHVSIAAVAAATTTSIPWRLELILQSSRVLRWLCCVLLPIIGFVLHNKKHFFPDQNMIEIDFFFLLLQLRKCCVHCPLVAIVRNTQTRTLAPYLHVHDVTANSRMYTTLYRQCPSSRDFVFYQFFKDVHIAAKLQKPK